jgi:hypothetical protein
MQNIYVTRISLFTHSKERPCAIRPVLRSASCLSFSPGACCNVNRLFFQTLTLIVASIFCLTLAISLKLAVKTIWPSWNEIVPVCTKRIVIMVRDGRPRNGGSILVRGKRFFSSRQRPDQTSEDTGFFFPVNKMAIGCSLFTSILWRDQEFVALSPFSYTPSWFGA